MRGDQRGVQIDRQPLRRADELPHTRTRASVRITQSIEQARSARDPINHPKRGRRRRRGPEQGSLIADRSQVRQTVTAVGEHHRQITDHPATVMTAGTQPRLADRDVQRPRQPDLSATCASNALPACETNPSPSALTFTMIWRPACVTFIVILPSRPCEHQQPAQCPLRRTVKRPRPSGPLLLHERSGLGGFAISDSQRIRLCRWPRFPLGDGCLDAFPDGVRQGAVSCDS